MITRKHVALPNPWVIRNTVEIHGIREAARILNNRKVVPFWYFYQCLFGKLPRTDAEIHDRYIDTCIIQPLKRMFNKENHK